MGLFGRLIGPTEIEASSSADGPLAKKNKKARFPRKKKKRFKPTSNQIARRRPAACVHPRVSCSVSSPVCARRACRNSSLRTHRISFFISWKTAAAPKKAVRALRPLFFFWQKKAKNKRRWWSLFFSFFFKSNHCPHTSFNICHL